MDCYDAKCIFCQYLHKKCNSKRILILQGAPGAFCDSMLALKQPTTTEEVPYHVIVVIPICSIMQKQNFRVQAHHQNQLKSRHPIQHFITVTSHRKLTAHPYRFRVLQNANSVTDCHLHYPTATPITCLLLIDQNDTQELLNSLGLLLQKLQIHFILVTTGICGHLLHCRH